MGNAIYQWSIFRFYRFLDLRRKLWREKMAGELEKNN